MKTQQAIFTQPYCDSLLNDLKTGVSIEKYLEKKSTFVFSDKDLCYLPNFYVDVDKLYRINNEEDLSNFEVAKLLYEAFPDLSPLIAAYDPFWLYLSHVELFEYNRKKWCNISSANGVAKSREKTIDYIRDYWFHSGSSMRSWLSGLWWSVYLSVEEQCDSPYLLTEILFRQEDLRTRTFGTYQIFRHKDACRAVLKFLRNNETLFEHSFQDKCRYVSKKLNLIGGSRQISFLKEEDFEMILNGMKSEIEMKFSK